MQNSSWKTSVFSDGSPQFVTPSFPKKGQKIAVRLRVFESAPIEKVWLKSFSRGSLSLTVARKLKVSSPFAYYTASISSTDHCIEYSFLIKTSEGCYHFNQAGLGEGLERQSCNFRLLQDCDLPEHFYGRTFYQIFPDRFYNGKPELTPQSGQINAHGHQSTRRNWDQKPLEYLKGYCLDYFGGDLPGVESKLDYLEDLGINGIYLNPIFDAPTHHKYDCQDYLNVDPHLGGNQSLENLSSQCSQRKIKLMLDISVNHTGITHPWKKTNPDYYHRTEWGIHKWAGVETLLTLDYENEQVHDVIYRSEDSILKHWLRKPYEIDAWRFDVAHCMAREGSRFKHEEVWREIRSHLKPEGNPYLLAEFWDDGRSFLQGDMWDGCMNYYGFCRPVRLFFGEPEWHVFSQFSTDTRSYLNAHELANQFSQALVELPYQIQHLQYNLLNSHDIHRMSSYSTLSLSSQIQAAALLMFHPGIASIYYGEEVALDGHFSSVEGCRYPMDWNSPRKNPLFKAYSKLAKMRSHNLFRLGSYRVIKAQLGLYIAIRFDEKDVCIIAIQRSDEPVDVTVDLHAHLLMTQRKSLKEVFSNKTDEISGSGKFNIKLSSQGCQIWKSW